MILAPGDVFLNADFGYQPPASQNNSIGDKVWFDADADGVGPNGNGLPGNDNSEQGIPGVTVALIKDVNGNGTWDAGDLIIATDTTDANGDYLFPGLPDGNYLVWVNDTDNVLGDKTPTYDKNGGTAPTGSGAPTGVASGTVLGLSAAALDPGSTNGSPVVDLTQDFGYTAPGQTSATGLIGDTIWFDTNNSGGATQDAGEPGIEGVVMELLGPGPDGIWGNGDDQVLATTTTDENGKYYFGGLKLDDGVGAAGADYRTRVATSNFAAGAVLQGLSNTYDPDGTTAVGTGTTVTLNAGEQDRPGAGLQLHRHDGRLRQHRQPVWQDLNANGIYEPALGETALAGVTIDLYRDLNGNGKVDAGEPKLSTQTTDASGLYLFSRLPLVGGGDADPQAEYVVNVTDAAGKLTGYWHSLSANQNASTNGGNDAADNSKVDPFAVEIGSGAGGQPVSNNLNVDFGYYVKPASLGNFVWNDLNGNGIQDANEPGLDGVKVTLTAKYFGGVSYTFATVTGDDPATGAVEKGWYSFGNLLLDEDNASSKTGAPTAAQPVYAITVPTAPAGLAPTLLNQGGNDMVDADDPAGVDGLATQGQTNVTQNANPNLETNPIAGYDFGYFRPATGAIGNYVWVDENRTATRMRASRGCRM